jgi:hypothetical protein
VAVTRRLALVTDWTTRRRLVRHLLLVVDSSSNETGEQHVLILVVISCVSSCRLVCERTACAGRGIAFVDQTLAVSLQALT